MDEKNGEKIIISKLFDAPCESVWKAWTTESVVKEWWAPEGFFAPSIEIDLRVGGKYLYCMHGMEGSKWDMDMYSAGEYKEIVLNKKIVVLDYFSDENGNKISPKIFGMSDDFPEESLVTILFENVENKQCKLTVIYIPDDDKQYEAMVKSGMREGWASSLNNLKRVLEKN